MAETVTRFPGPDHDAEGASAAEDLAADSALQIGDWRFEPSLNRLTRGDESVRLEPKLADLLLLLARNRGDLVAKEEIVDSVWQGRFIADSALTRAMAELRRALGDDAHAPIYIETISKRGYRLVAEVRSIEATGGGGGTLRRSLVVGALLALSAVIAIFLIGRGQVSPAASVTVSTLVVLPLEDLSPAGRGEDYFAPAMTEALTTDLARVGAFRVISQRSLDQFLDTEGSLNGVAAGLGADAAVEGSIVRADGRVRINAQLTDAQTDTVLWADSYQRDLVDILSLQSEVARAIVTALESSVASGFEAKTTPEPPQVDPRAHDLFLQGQQALERCSWEGPNEAVDLFTRAVEADPDFAPAHAGLAEYYAKLTLFDFMPPHDGFPKARGAALRALELNPDSADAQTALGQVEFMFDWNWEQAELSFLRAIDLNPNSAEARRAYSFFLTCMGRFDEAVEQARVEIEIDPLNKRSHLPWVLFNARRYAESLAELKATGSRHGVGMESQVIGWNYAQLERYDEAVELLSRITVSRGSDDAITLGVLGWTLASAGRSDEARAILKQLEELNAAQERGDLYPQLVVLAGLGETERALDLLEQAIVQRSPNAIFLAVEPFLDPLADSPRFLRLLDSMNLPRPQAGASHSSSSPGPSATR